MPHRTTTSTHLVPRLTAAATAAAVSVGALAAFAVRPEPGAPSAAPPTASDLPEFATKVAHAPRVADGVAPPTNSWISGAVYDMAGVDAPTWVGGGLAFRAHDTSVGVALPEVTGYGDFAIMQTWDNRATPDDPESQVIELAPPGATSYLLSDWDDISAELTWYAGTEPVGTLTAVEGWPYVMYTAATQQSLAVNRPLSAEGGRHSWTAPTGQELNVVTDAEVSGGGIALDAGETVHVFGTPQDAGESDVDTLVQGAVPVLGTTTRTTVSGGEATATFELQTEGGAPTVLAQMPHQDYGLPLLEGRWENPTGWARGAVGTSFSTSAPTWDVSAELDLSGLTEPERVMLAEQVVADTEEVLSFPSDTYFGGKALYRAANLYTLAGQLGLTDEAARIKAAMVEQLDRWMDLDRCAEGIVGQCFGFDAANRTVVPDTDGFHVASMLNDHHFHYGYLLYAAAVLARDDASLVEAYRPMADILAADIASEETTGTTIQRRAFDDWRGHSWANGLGGGMDGNDQESTSEAMNAWAGLALWSQVAGDASMAEHARWLMAFEAATAEAYWWNPYRGETSTAPIASMVFQGKSTYETWFSGDASAKTAIEVIPMGPSQLAFLRSLGEDRIREIAEPLFEGEYAGRPLIDWNTAFLGLADPERALEIARSLPSVDNGNTRSYLYAVILAGAAAPGGEGPAPTTDPEPTDPEPTDPEPTDPEPTDPEPTDPEPTDPEPTNPEPTNPEPTDPEPTDPQPTAPALDAYAPLTAADAVAVDGVDVADGATSPAGDGDWLAFEVDFGDSGPRDVLLEHAGGADGAASALVQVRLDSPDGPVLGSAAVSHTGGWDAFRRTPFNVAGLEGRQRIYLTVDSGAGVEVVRIASLQFRR